MELFLSVSVHTTFSFFDLKHTHKDERKELNEQTYKHTNAHTFLQEIEKRVVHIKKEDKI